LASSEDSTPVIGAADEYVLVTSAAVAAGITPRLLRHAVETGKLEGRQGALGLLVRRSDVARLIAPQRHKQGSRVMPARKELTAQIVHLLIARQAPISISRLHRALTSTSGASYPTVAARVRQLVDEGVLVRKAYGKVYLYALAMEAEARVENEAGWLAVTDSDAANLSSYRQIEDTSWWEGEPGAALPVGERSYRPAEQAACLTLAAVYDDKGSPCYWLAANEGKIIERSSGGGEAKQSEVLLPASSGHLIGSAALVVGRLFPPTTPEHSLAREQRHRAAQRARLDPARLGSLLASYQHHYVISSATLAERLRASGTALDNIFLCLRPEPFEEEERTFSRYTRLVADIDGVPVHALGLALRDALHIEREEVVSGGKV